MDRIPAQGEFVAAPSESNSMSWSGASARFCQAVILNPVVSSQLLPLRDSFQQLP